MRRVATFLASILSGQPMTEETASPKDNDVPTPALGVNNAANSKGIISADGFGVIASCGGEQEAREHHFAKATEMEYAAIGPSNLFFEKCAHVGPRKFVIKTWDAETRSYEVPHSKISGVIRKVVATDVECPKCFFESMQKHSIRCCLCGGSIIPGEGVALYSLQSGGIDKHATLVDGSAIGCLRMSCCPSLGFFAGHWTEEGFVPADFAKICKRID